MEKCLYSKLCWITLGVFIIWIRKSSLRCVTRILFYIFIADLPKPRYARVNTLKMDVESALIEFKKQYEV